MYQFKGAYVQAAGDLVSKKKKSDFIAIVFGLFPQELCQQKVMSLM